ncbi:hypothetical protein J3F83DRAFT_727790 [Trichoderma novae-zelandiae]
MSNTSQHHSKNNTSQCPSCLKPPASPCPPTPQPMIFQTTSVWHLCVTPSPAPPLINRIPAPPPLHPQHQHQQLGTQPNNQPNK